MTAFASARRRALPLAVVLAAAVLAGGCEEDVSPAGSLTQRYTVWGALDPSSDTQRLRVVPITGTISLGDPAPLPAVVTSVDLETGAETAWRDSVITFADGSIGHVYVASFRPAYGSRTVVRIGDPGDEPAQALVAVPPRITPVRLTSEVTALNGLVYPVLWPDAPRLNRVRAQYLLQDITCETFVVEQDVTPATSGPSEFGWTVALSIPREVENGLGVVLNQRGPLGLLQIEITGEVASEDWRPPGGVFDPEVLVEPGVLTNVRGGFGFVGASYPTSVRWTPTSAELRATPFRTSGC